MSRFAFFAFVSCLISVAYISLYRHRGHYRYKVSRNCKEYCSYLCWYWRVLALWFVENNSEYLLVGPIQDQLEDQLEDRPTRQTSQRTNQRTNRRTSRRTTGKQRTNWRTIWWITFSSGRVHWSLQVRVWISSIEHWYWQTALSYPKLQGPLQAMDQKWAVIETAAILTYRVEIINCHE